VTGDAQGSAWRKWQLTIAVGKDDVGVVVRAEMVEADDWTLHAGALVFSRAGRSWLVIAPGAWVRLEEMGP